MHSIIAGGLRGKTIFLDTRFAYRIMQNCVLTKYMARPKLWQDKSHFEGFVNWVLFQLEKDGLSHGDFAKLCGMPLTTWQNLRELKATWNEKQVNQLLKGLAELGHPMTMAEFEEKVASTQSERVPTTAKALLKAWDLMDDPEKWAAAIEISEEVLQISRALLSPRPDVALVRLAVAKNHRSVTDWANEKGLPVVRTNALYDEYKIRLSRTEFRDYARALTVGVWEDRFRPHLERCLLMENQVGDSQRFVDLIDYNCARLGVESIDHLAELLAKNSRSEEFFREVLRKTYLEREPINLRNNDHSDLLWEMAKSFTDTDGKSFNGKLKNICKYCGFEET